MKWSLLDSYWYRFPQGAVSGCLFDEAGTLYEGASLAAYFSDVEDVHDLTDRLRAANGKFAVCLETGTITAFATDRLNSYALYYQPEGIIVSDTASAVPSKGRLDRLAEAFYLSSGATPPGSTLLEDVWQLPAASLAMREGQDWTVFQYDSYGCSLENERDCSVLELSHRMEDVFRRMIRRLGGRQAVVPLTGGNDSRLILCMLRRFNYTNVLCYTVGKRSFHDCVLAAEAAKKLGYRHLCIDPSAEDISPLCSVQDADFERYYRYVGGLTNFVWLYDYAAIRYLRHQRLLSDDAVFIPGHSGDTIAGSHLLKAGVSPRDTAYSLTQKLMYIDFEYSCRRSVLREVKNWFDQALRDGATPYSAFQTCVVQHRQAQNIVHSVRAIRYFGYEVYLPLWDRVLYDTFSRLPYSSLDSCRLYSDYVRSVFQPLGLSVSAYGPRVPLWKARWKRWLKPLVPMCLWLRERLLLEPSGEGAMALQLWDELRHSERGVSLFSLSNVNALLCRWYLMRVKKGDR